MKIDSAIGVFTEKFDNEAIRSIDDVSKEFGLNIHGHTIKLFNLKESFDAFAKYLQGYGTYKTQNMNNPQASPHAAICEATTKFIDGQLFKEADIPYGQLPDFVKGYVEGVTSLLSTVEEVKQAMMEAGVDLGEVGDVNGFVDHFMEGLDKAFYPAMDKILWASGYNSKQVLEGNKKHVPPHVSQVSFI